MSSVNTLSADGGWLRRGEIHFHTSSALHPYQVENGALLGYYAASIGKKLPLTEELNSQLLRGGSLKSLLSDWSYNNNNNNNVWIFLDTSLVVVV